MTQVTSLHLIAGILSDRDQHQVRYGVNPLPTSEEKLDRPLGMTADGQLVFEARNSHINDHGARELVIEAIPRIDASMVSEPMPIQVDLGRVLGESLCVPTSSEDQIIFANRPPRTYPSRLVIGREGIEVSTAVLVLRRNPLGKGLVCVTAYVGAVAPPEPSPFLLRTDPVGYAAAIRFWSSHALLLDRMQIDEASISVRRPWETAS